MNKAYVYGNTYDSFLERVEGKKQLAFPWYYP
jgi:hypothetical protein